MKNQVEKEIEKRTIFKQFTFKLTREETAKKAEEMAAIDFDLMKLNSDFEMIKQDWKGRISGKENERRKISHTVRMGEENRNVECVQELDFSTNAVRYVFKGEILEERAMTMEERQAQMDFEAKGRVHDFKASAAGDNDLNAVIGEETRSRTKHSSVDGPRV